MPAKKKGARGKTLNVVDFNDDFVPEDNLDWAAEVPQEEKTGQELLSEKIAKRDFSRTANNALAEKDGFRSAPSMEVARPKGVEDLQPPYVAHFGNLRNGTTEEDFLRNFHEDVVATSRLISQDGKSFAFVEFKTAQALAIALMMDQTMVRGRKLYVDLATQKQIERLHGHSGMARQSAGQSQQNLHNLNLTRDAFGATQSERDMGSRSGFSSRNDLHALGELSRDVLGTARTSDGSPSPTGPPDFSSWRNEAPLSQPEFQTALRDNQRSENDLERRGGGGGFRGSKHQSPLGMGGLANWRDEPIAQPPPPSTAAAGTAGPEESTEGGRKGPWSRGDGAGRGSRATPKQPLAPRDDSKWEALRR